MAEVAGGVEEVHSALDVHLAVDEGVLDAVADGGHGGEVGDGVGFMGLQQFAEGWGVGEIAFDEAEAGFGEQVGEVAIFVFYGVVVVEVVEADYLVAAG